MFFDQIKEGQPDAIFGLLGAFTADPRPQKVNLLVGIYKDEHLKSELMPSVRKAKEQIVSQDLLADFLPFEGLPAFVDEIGKLVFSKEGWKEAQERIYGAQAVGGTSALRIGAEFLTQEVTKSVFVPNPTWPNHRSVFERADCRVETYPYYSRETHGLDFDAMVQALDRLPPKTAVVLHASCHNPTGSDPDAQQWKELSLLMREKKLIPFFDFAYQGLGDIPDKEAQAIQIFMQDRHEMIIAYSCSKNFSMYCQRVGALFIVTEKSSVKSRVASQTRRLIRTLYSNPPAHGARIVAQILKEESLNKQWLKDLEAMRYRLCEMRQNLVQNLMNRAKRTDFTYLQHHKGMFSFIDLDKTQCRTLIDKYGIYLLDNGRINVAGLTAGNMDYVVKGLISVCEP